MLIAGLFSMWVENTATAAVLIPVALTVASLVPDPKKAKGFLILLVMVIAYSASLGGMATVMGAGSNTVATGFLQELGPFTFGVRISRGQARSHPSRQRFRGFWAGEGAWCGRDGQLVNKGVSLHL